MAAVLVVAAVAALGLRMQPGVGGRQHPLRGASHRPGLGRGVVVVQEAAHRGGAGHLADRAAADAVGQRQHRCPWWPAGRRVGTTAPWKSWLSGLAARGPSAGRWPPAVQHRVAPAAVELFGGCARRHLYRQARRLGAVLVVRGVQRGAHEGEATHQVAQHGGHLVPQQVVHERELAAQHQAGGEQEHVDDAVLEAHVEEHQDGHPHAR
jgi:hypothetical protein